MQKSHIADDLRAGRLLAPSAIGLRSAYAYHLLMRRPSSPAAEIFADWLQALAGEALIFVCTVTAVRPPGRFDFVLDTETFAFFNYQYILYGMGFETDLSAGRDDFPRADEAARVFAKIQRFADRAVADLPTHRGLIQQINAAR